MKDQFFKANPKLNEAWEAMGIVVATEDEVNMLLAGVPNVKAVKVYRDGRVDDSIVYPENTNEAGNEDVDEEPITLDRILNGSKKKPKK